MRNMLITGGAGFIGCNFVRYMLTHEPDVNIVNLDALTYAGSRENLTGLPAPERHTFVEGSITDRALVDTLMHKHRIDTVVHFAAETHVDRSIHHPEAFLETNVVGTFTLLEAARQFWLGEGAFPREAVLFHHVSTDEVYGTLHRRDAPAFTEETPYAPRSPYAASKAASDHYVKAYFHTYGLPITITNCSNNYGPHQFPEKLIPVTILNALEGKPLPIYGDGMQIRDWLYVDDHSEAIRRVLRRGRRGETYNVGGDNQPSNLEIVQTICHILDELRPASAPAPQRPPAPNSGGVIVSPPKLGGRGAGEGIPPNAPRPTSHEQLITHVADRPGHDRRYDVDITKIKRELGWQPTESLASGLLHTVRWYLEHPEWTAAIRAREDYQAWMERNYAQRL